MLKTNQSVVKNVTSFSSYRLRQARHLDTRGQLYVWLAVLGFGLNPLFAKLAYMDGLSPEILILCRVGLPTLLMAPFLRQALAYPHLIPLALIAGGSVSIGTWLYFRALLLLPVATVSLVYYTYPLFTIFFGRLLFKEPFTRRSILVIGLILAATGLIVQPASFSSIELHTLLLSFTAPISFAFLLQSFQHGLAPLPILPRIAVVNMGQLIGMIPLFFGVTFPFMPLSRWGWLGLLGASLLSSLLPQLLLSHGIRGIGATKSSVIMTAELVIVLIIGWVLLGEPLILLEVVGGILMLTAILIVSRNPNPAVHN